MGEKLMPLKCSYWLLHYIFCWLHKWFDLETGTQDKMSNK
jgi:hypothetical protein